MVLIVVLLTFLPVGFGRMMHNVIQSNPRFGGIQQRAWCWPAGHTRIHLVGYRSRNVAIVCLTFFSRVYAVNY